MNENEKRERKIVGLIQTLNDKLMVTYGSNFANVNGNIT